MQTVNPCPVRRRPPPPHDRREVVGIVVKAEDNKRLTRGGQGGLGGASVTGYRAIVRVIILSRIQNIVKKKKEGLI